MDFFSKNAFISAFLTKNGAHVFRTIAKIWILGLILASSALPASGQLERKNVAFVQEFEGFKLVGQVVDSETGEPIQSALIKAVFSNGREALSRSDAQGRFAVGVWGEGETSYRLEISARGYDSKTTEGRVVLHTAGTHDVGQIGLHYHPFDLSLSEQSRSLSREQGESWPSVELTVTLENRNGYDNAVELGVEAPEGIEAEFENARLRFRSPVSTVLTLTPGSALSSGTYTVTVKACDAWGRLAASASYTLTLSTRAKQTAAAGGSGGGSGSGGESDSSPLVIKVVDAATGSGISGASVVLKRQGTTEVVANGTTGPDGTVEFTPPRVWVDAFVSKSGWVAYNASRQAVSTVHTYFYAGSGTRTFYLSNIGVITGLKAEDPVLEFERVNETRQTTLTVQGDYSKSVDTTYDLYYYQTYTPREAVYHVWTKPTSVSGSGQSYTFKGKCLRWQPPTGINFHPGAHGSRRVAWNYWGSSWADTPGAQTTVTLRQKVRDR